MRTFEIDLNIAKESDLYNPLDPTGRTISSDIMGYIDEQLEDRELGESLTLSIICPEPVDEQRLHDAMVLTEERIGRRLRKEKRALQVNSLRLVLIGVVFILIGILGKDTLHVVMSSIIGTIGSFSIWEAANAWLQQIPRIRKEQRILRAISDHPDVRVTAAEACVLPWAMQGQQNPR